MLSASSVEASPLPVAAVPKSFPVLKLPEVVLERLPLHMSVSAFLRWAATCKKLHKQPERHITIFLGLLAKLKEAAKPMLVYAATVNNRSLLEGIVSFWVTHGRSGQESPYVRWAFQAAVERGNATAVQTLYSAAIQQKWTYDWCPPMRMDDLLMQAANSDHPNSAAVLRSLLEGRLHPPSESFRISSAVVSASTLLREVLRAGGKHVREKISALLQTSKQAEPRVSIFCSLAGVLSDSAASVDLDNKESWGLSPEEFLGLSVETRLAFAEAAYFNGFVLKAQDITSIFDTLSPSLRWPSTKCLTDLFWTIKEAEIKVVYALPLDGCLKGFRNEWLEAFLAGLADCGIRVGAEEQQRVAEEFSAYWGNLTESFFKYQPINEVLTATLGTMVERANFSEALPRQLAAIFTYTHQIGICFNQDQIQAIVDRVDKLPEIKTFTRQAEDPDAIENHSPLLDFEFEALAELLGPESFVPIDFSSESDQEDNEVQLVTQFEVLSLDLNSLKQQVHAAIRNGAALHGVILKSETASVVEDS